MPILVLTKIFRTRRALSCSSFLDKSAGMLEALRAPANISLAPLPNKTPELNPIENVWKCMYDSRLSLQVHCPADRLTLSVEALILLSR